MWIEDIGGQVDGIENTNDRLDGHWEGASWNALRTES